MQHVLTVSAGVISLAARKFARISLAGGLQSIISTIALYNIGHAYHVVVLGALPDV